MAGCEVGPLQSVVPGRRRVHTAEAGRPQRPTGSPRTSLGPTGRRSGRGGHGWPRDRPASRHHPDYHQRLHLRQGSLRSRTISRLRGKLSLRRREIAARAVQPPQVVPGAILSERIVDAPTDVETPLVGGLDGVELPAPSAYETEGVECVSLHRQVVTWRARSSTAVRCSAEVRGRFGTRHALRSVLDRRSGGRRAPVTGRPRAPRVRCYPRGASSSIRSPGGISSPPVPTESVPPNGSGN